MKPVLNTLFITTDGSYLHRERETLVVEQEQAKVFQCPIHALQNIFCFGRVMVSPGLMELCAQHSIGIVFFTQYGRFISRVIGKQTGNVLLRRAQYRLADNAPQHLAKIFVAAKIANSRHILMKQQRNHGANPALEAQITQLAGCLRRLKNEEDVDTIRGIEGDAGARYFSVFNQLINPDQLPAFQFNGRSRRPPTDPTNALLSFCYSLLTHECAAALQAAGIDPYVGYLHTDRPGRVSLALDMLEEFRAWWCDRFVLSLINRKQVKASGFITEASGAVRMTDDTRKKVLTEWQQRKQEQITHPYTGDKTLIGHLHSIQALLLGRYMRNDLDQYPPFTAK